MSAGKPLSGVQKAVLAVAFVPMLATGVAGGIGTYSNISGAYGKGTALGAVAAGEGATAVLALVLLGLTMLGQSSPGVIRAGLWALPAAASVMAVTAADDPGRAVIYGVTPMGMTVSAEGMAFLARRIVVHLDGRDAEAEAHAAAVVRELAYHRARAANHPDEKKREASERRSWKLARRVGAGDSTLGTQLLDVQRERVTAGADVALGGMFTLTPHPDSPPAPEGGEGVRVERDGSTPEQEQSSEQVPAAPGVLPLQLPAPVDPMKPTEKPTETRQLRAVPAASARPVRVTRRVPEVARSPRPKRTPDELLTQARTLTADWSAEELTAEAIRRAVRTSSEKARGLRDTLRAERHQEAA